MKATRLVVDLGMVVTCIVFAAHPVTAAQPGDTVLGKLALKKSTGVSNTAIGTFTMSPNAICESPGVPLACCTGVRVGTCGDNSACTGPGAPHGCCSAVGVGTCGAGGSRNTAVGYGVLLLTPAAKAIRV